MRLSTERSRHPAWIVGALLSAALVASCGGDDAAPDASVTALGTADAQTTSPTSTSHRLYVSGTAECDWSDGPAQTKEGKTVVHSGTLTCVETMSDPRVSGRDDIQLTETYIPQHEIARFVCESETLTTDGGIWRGDCYGSEYWDEQGGLFTNGHASLLGEGAYEGLVYEVLFTQSPGGGPYLYVGYIEPAA